jgi:hypothetical protein
MFKRYIAFIWNINHDGAPQGGWDHVVRNDQDHVLSWDTLQEANAALPERIETFWELQSRRPEIDGHIIDLHTGERSPISTLT